MDTLLLQGSNNDRLDIEFSLEPDAIYLESVDLVAGVMAFRARGTIGFRRHDLHDLEWRPTGTCAEFDGRFGSCFRKSHGPTGALRSEWASWLTIGQDPPTGPLHTRPPSTADLRPAAETLRAVIHVESREMTMHTNMTPPRLSVISPAHDEQENVLPLVEEIHAALKDLQGGFEVIVIDDGSNDETGHRLVEAASSRPWLRVIAMTQTPAGRGNGQSAAFHAGVENARG